MNPLFTFFELPIATFIITYILVLIFKIVGIIAISWMSVLILALLVGVCCAFCACVIAMVVHYWSHS